MTKAKPQYFSLFQRFFPSFFICFSIACNTLYHGHQILPACLIGMGTWIKSRQLESARFEFHVVDDQAATFHVQYFHAGTGAVDKDVHIAILYVTAHQVGHHPAEGIKAPAHIRWTGIQIVPHG